MFVYPAHVTCSARLAVPRPTGRFRLAAILLLLYFYGLHSMVLRQPIRCVRSKQFSNRAQDRAYTRLIRPPRAGWYGAY